MSHLSTPVDFPPVELPSRYAKAFAAVGMAGLTTLVAATAEGSLDALGTTHVGIAVLAALLVYVVPMLEGPLLQFSKAAIAVLGSAAHALIPFLTVGVVTPHDLLYVLIAALGALTVGITPNAPSIEAQYAEADRLA